MKQSKPKQKTCKTCGHKFTPFNSLQQTCATVDCAVPHGKKMQQKAHKAETRAMKKALNDKDRGYWIKKAQTAFNAYVRERDKHLPCISCGMHHTGQYHAGHYLSTGAHPELRFHPFNNNKQCAPCNNHLSGNQIRYRPRLIEKIGLSNVVWLEGPHEAQNWSIDDLKEIEQYYKEQLKLIKTTQE